jgi:hypothetical protein
LGTPYSKTLLRNRNDWALDEADLREVMRVRSPDSRLWTALHLCGLRRAGRFIDDSEQVPVFDDFIQEAVGCLQP